MYEAEIKFIAPPGFRLPGTRLADAVYRDVYFDTPDGAFYASGRELRLREADGQTFCTCKNPPFDAASASKEELSTAVADTGAMEAVLTGLGFVRRMAYVKHCRRSRTMHNGLALELTLVTVDFAAGTFVEIEHQARDRALGLAALPVIRSYGAAIGLTREYPRAYTDLFLDARDRDVTEPRPC
ncbi:adenylate cyclase [Solidesulfovibrio fructosivorans JJ]]|uniref:Adenylate cyclase n=1 Tax=Solidesulfovibrio fructosivorans JJ] TaxID=596151 RepID=E1K2K0_SOLFR|nr:CYTH domain-containing protein [Solidesulfovibrio fructosivorans]EFL49165.1 adenylate cyclase [Solidesulfovibrio fructosivorans JJ]]